MQSLKLKAQLGRRLALAYRAREVAVREMHKLAAEAAKLNEPLLLQNPVDDEPQRPRIRFAVVG